MDNKLNDKDKYAYVIKQPNIIRMVYLLAFLTWIFVIIGMVKFFNLNLLYWFIFFPLFLPMIVSKMITYIVSVFYPKFDLKEHKKKVKQFFKDNEGTPPSVDVFLPIAGESIEVLAETWEGVSNIDYDNYNVYVLEDKIDPAARRLAERYRFNYLSRPNKGYFKKAGNLKYGYEHSDGEFILILDADFVPHKDIIKEMIPYMEPEIGIVQTPQYFDTNNEVHKRSKIEFGAGNVVEDFYRILQPARNQFGAAICVGTNSMHRRTAIFESHAPALVERSEDVVGGLTLLKHGYELMYIPIILAKGICPDNVESLRPHISCPFLYSVISEPTASIVPENDIPGISYFGPNTPINTLTRNGSAFLIRTSAEFTALALTLRRISSGLIIGLGLLPINNTSGLPYFLVMTAFIV
jgi:cellulose synthase (UDP-forming)